MYAYYMLAAMGPKYRRYIWWKKYLTNFQMIQFVMIFSHAFQVILKEGNFSCLCSTHCANLDGKISNGENQFKMPNST